MKDKKTTSKWWILWSKLRQKIHVWTPPGSELTHFMGAATWGTSLKPGWILIQKKTTNHRDVFLCRNLHWECQFQTDGNTFKFGRFPSYMSMCSYEINEIYRKADMFMFILGRSNLTTTDLWFQPIWKICSSKWVHLSSNSRPQWASMSLFTSLKACFSFGDHFLGLLLFRYIYRSCSFQVVIVIVITAGRAQWTLSTLEPSLTNIHMVRLPW